MEQKGLVEQKLKIYTHGNVWIEAAELIHVLNGFGVNCVVDCRPQGYTTIGGNMPMDELRRALKQAGIVYLPFSDHFGVFPMETRDKHGEIDYEKVCATANFIRGMERIDDGMRKGYHICIIDHERDTYKSRRFTLLGRFLAEKYCVMHIYPSGHCYSQEQVAEKISEYINKRKRKINAAQDLGRSGEELTALYLSRNGYLILDRNWNLHHGCELDLVALKDNRLHFIEVKTRSSDQYGEPQNAINKQKLRHIAKAIQTYRYRRFLLHADYQIDSVAIIYRADNDYDLTHFLGIRLNGGACDEIKSFSTRP